jgi:hypothetical protein
VKVEEYDPEIDAWDDEESEEYRNSLINERRETARNKTIDSFKQAYGNFLFPN